MNTEKLPRLDCFYVAYKDFVLSALLNKSVARTRLPALHAFKKPLRSFFPFDRNEEFVVDHKVVPDIECVGVFFVYFHDASHILFWGTNTLNKNTASRRSIS